MLWSPTGPTVEVLATATPFRAGSLANLGGVARLHNRGAAVVTFSIGSSTVTDTQLIPLSVGQDIIVAFGPTDTHAIASAAASIFITPGIGRP